MERMRAVVYSASGAEPAPATVPAPLCPDDGVVIMVRATGVCRSDWHAWRGHEPVVLPHIGGHEFAGVVLETGAEVARFAPGQRVTAPFVNGCGRCVWCRRGAAQVCPDQTQPGFTHPGSFAERVVVRAADLNLVAVPDTIDFVTAAGLGCRFATAFRAVTAHVSLQADDPVVIIGCGGLGLSAIMIATALGGRVVAVDPSPVARARAVELGATAALPPEQGPEMIMEATGGGAVLAVDAFGSAASADLSVRALRRQGHHVQAGLMVGDAAHASLPWDRVIAQELMVHGSHGMAAADYPPMLTMITEGRLDPERLVGTITDLAGIPAALTAMDEPVAASSGTVVAVP